MSYSNNYYGYGYGFKWGYYDYVNNHPKYYNLHWNNDVVAKRGYDDGWTSAQYDCYDYDDYTTY